MNNFDAIVIGAGNGGLTAATALQRGGAKTLLLERHNIPGGCATSFVRGDFEFEVALHQLSGMGTEEFPFVLRHIFAELGILEKLDVVVERDLYRYVKPDVVGGTHTLDITLPADWETLGDHLIEHFPQEQAAIVKFLELCEGLCGECFMVLPKARHMQDTDNFTKTCPLYTQFGLRSAKDVLDEFFQNRELKAVIAAYWCYLGMPPKDFPFKDLAIMFYSYAAIKPCHVKGGSQAISSALLESFIAAGGEVRFNTSAEKILTENNCVKAVVTEHGETFSSQQIISNISPLHTYNELLDIPTPKQAVEDMKSRRIGTSAFVLYIGLDCEPSEIGVTVASSFICDELDEEIAHALMTKITPPKHTMLTCYNYDDPSFAPEGKSVISLLCLQYGEPWQDIAPEDYARVKYDFAEHLLDHAERVFPNIRQHIEEVEVATPLTMMRYLNTPHGAIYGFTQNTQDANIFRRRINEVAGLHMAGSWMGMGGFQPTYMAGHATAKSVLKALKTYQQKELANV